MPAAIAGNPSDAECVPRFAGCLSRRILPRHGSFPLAELFAPGLACSPRLFKYVMTCQRDGSGRELQEGIPRRKLPFLKNQKI
jgi:hypothetical protein